MLLLVTLRGGLKDEPQHSLMGNITLPQLELMGIPWRAFPTTDDEIDAALEWAEQAMEEGPCALVVSKGALAPSPAPPRARGPARAAVTAPIQGPHGDAGAATPPIQGAHGGAGDGAGPDPPFRGPRASAAGALPIGEMRREDVLRRIQAAVRADDVLVATTGFTGRELYALDDRPSQLYMVGSMGCAAPLGLGLALARPDRRVVVIDGDGALLMRMGACATIGAEAPPNLVHVLLDNGMHESTGGQPTVSPRVDFLALAAACGYGSVSSELELDGVGPRFIHVPITPGHPADLPRPMIRPPEVARRLRAFLGSP
jgi:phosphonopyruvate decarboxylase